MLVSSASLPSFVARRVRVFFIPSAPRQRGAHRRALAWEPRLLVSRLGRGMASIVALLDTFDDAASLSRAAALADDMQRQRAVLQDELAAVERALPAALAAVQSNTRSAIEQLDRLADERSALEESVAQQMGVSQQLLAKLEPPLIKLSQLDEARLTQAQPVPNLALSRAPSPLRNPDSL